METTIVLRKEELNNEFIEGIKKIFKNYNKLQITVSNSDDKNDFFPESKDNYFSRLEQASKDVNLGNKITFLESEFDELTKSAKNENLI